MADKSQPGLVGQGKRVAGVFAFMIGASVILDAHALWLGMPAIAFGAVLFGWGVAETRTPEPFSAAQHDVTTETHL